jgi:diacylglycerol kinase family enzyme
VRVRIVLIVNPFASNVAERHVREVEAALGRAGGVETRLTERPGHATELAAAAAGAGADAVVVFGGDGVVNEALNGLGSDVLFGALPGGGTSVFARALGLPRDPVAAAGRIAGAIVAGRSRRITVGRVEGRRFCFAAGLGFDAAMVRRVDARGRSRDGRRPGDLAFVRAFARELAAGRFRLGPRLEVVGLGRAATAFVANCDPYTYAGGVALHFAPRARFELGLDVAAPVEVSARALPGFARFALAGGEREPPRGLLSAHDLDRIEIACDLPLPLQVDGEDLGDVEHAVFEAERDAVSSLA